MAIVGKPGVSGAMVTKSNVREFLMANTLPSLMVEPTLNPMEAPDNASFLSRMSKWMTVPQTKRRPTTPKQRNRFVPASKKAIAKTRDNRRKTADESRRRNRAS